MRKFLREQYIKLDASIKKRKLKQNFKQGKRRIVVGSSNVYQKDWSPTEISFLNLTNSNDWSALFEKNTIEAILAEHVWEHLTLEDSKIAIQNCFTYLQSNGYLRIAVPDGFHPDKEYIDLVKPGGTGDGSWDHKVLYNYQSLTNILTTVGFTVKPLEYFDENGQFHFNEWQPEKGMVYRSSRFDRRNTETRIAYSSLIIDAIKP